jgi:hypothetical protein
MKASSQKTAGKSLKRISGIVTGNDTAIIALDGKNG